MPIDTILFDVGGVLFAPLDDDAVWHNRTKLAKKLGYRDVGQMWNRFFSGSEWHLTKTGQWTDAQMWAALLSPHGITGHLDQQMFRDQLYEDVGLRADMRRIVQALYPHFKLAILSNASDRLDFILSEKIAIAHYFDVIVNSHYIGVAKPDRYAYEITLHHLQQEAKQVFFIDDQLRNIDAANELGIEGHVFEGVGKLKDELRRRTFL